MQRLKFYFAGSIQGGRKDVLLYQDIIKILEEYGNVLTEHVGNKTMDERGEYTKTAEFIRERDLKWIKECDIFIAEITQPSLGVGYEIRDAELQDKPCVCLYRGETTSSMIKGSPWILTIHYQTLRDIRMIFAAFLPKIQEVLSSS